MNEKQVVNPSRNLILYKFSVLIVQVTQTDETTLSLNLRSLPFASGFENPLKSSIIVFPSLSSR